ncbi:hypothetical protein QYE76_008496 [Lolium multiflorum]|uniref:DUF4283 domain-containing protein n=1 Tax=Lolium multiflorum TaxID=4521 RepID=A0AAD8TT21_LOLMU|nr:hypothetical protein QYE76_008496 [Lolium multiflorum]
MEAELKDLVVEDWEWRVQKLTNSDFAVFFPSKESLRMAIRGGGLTLPSSKLHVIVTSSSGDPAAAEKLLDVWVKLFDVPPPFRQAVRILVATRELGRPIAVDEGSLESPLDPVRLLLGCKQPLHLPPFFTLFVDSQGFRVRVVPELAHAGEVGAPPPPPPKPTDDQEEDLDESEEDGWDGRRGKHNRKDKAEDPKLPTTVVGPKHKSAQVTQSEAQPSASGIKLLATAFSQYGSNLCKSGDIFPTLAKLLTPSRLSTDETEDTEGGQPPFSPSQITESATPEELAASGQSRPSLWKAQPLSEEDRAELGLPSPSLDSDPEAMLARERRSKNNNDRPSKVHSPVVQEVAIQLDFLGESVT